MRIWVDDIRQMPAGFDVHMVSAFAATAAIVTGKVTKISLDHDLGSESEFGNGYMIAEFIEAQAFHGAIPRIEWSIHSQNIVGCQKMFAALNNADRYWLSHGM